MTLTSTTWRLFALGLVLAVLALAGCTDDPAGAMSENPTLAATAVAGLPDNATPTSYATFTPIPTLTTTPSPGPSRTPGPSATPTTTTLPTNTPDPTATPTSIPQTDPVLSNIGTAVPFLTATPPTAVPTHVPEFDVPSGVTNVLLLGSDDPVNENVGRTDTIIIASINRDTKTASMVSLPRDLYVYIPGRTMSRINTALPLGGVDLLKDTILYNFGVPIHYYARIDFSGFEEVVDAIGGVDVAVSCPLTDHRLKSPDLDPEEEESWELFRVDAGIHHMDGATALWYARSRESVESDWGRIKRQQQILRAIFEQGVDLNLLPRVPTLYNTYKDTVETDMDIGRILQLASLAPAVQENGIQHLYIAGDQVQPWTVSGSDPPMNVQLPRWENMQRTFEQLFAPPALNRGNRAPIYVEVVNGTDNPDMALLAADNLSWYGFVPIIAPAGRQDYETTTITYYGANLKGAFDQLLSWIFGKRSGDIQLIPDQPYEYDYRVVLGADYDPCVNRLFAPGQ